MELQWHFATLGDIIFVDITSDLNMHLPHEYFDVKKK